MVRPNRPTTSTSLRGTRIFGCTPCPTRTCARRLRHPPGQEHRQPRQLRPGQPQHLLCARGTGQDGSTARRRGHAGRAVAQRQAAEGPAGVRRRQGGRCGGRRAAGGTGGAAIASTSGRLEPERSLRRAACRGGCRPQRYPPPAGRVSGRPYRWHAGHVDRADQPRLPHRRGCHATAPRPLYVRWRGSAGCAPRYRR